ncbi:heterokaryon incompatibility protein-domain-containing protein [Bisporella sp. PMI_857]|nr:heterokaryon incompatibility protein-domain-containing protein [Bisporella sp. PMI_857]
MEQIRKVSKPLCDRCISLELRFATDSDFTHLVADNFQDLEQSSLTGCALCGLVRQHLVYGTRSKIHNLRTSQAGIHITVTATDIMIEPVVHDDDRVLLWPRDDLYLSGYTEYDSDEGVSGRQVETSAGMIQSTTINRGEIQLLSKDEGINNAASLARDWITKCLETHSSCLIPFGATEPPTTHRRELPALPTRVINVGEERASHRPRLFIPAPGERQADYFALSYAWGIGSYPARMTKSNMTAMQRGIDMSSLPKTMQDAIIFTKRAGLTRYLWIDALCIIQTDGDGGGDHEHRADWLAECSKFGQYYHNALCTLSATGASCSTQGLFLPRPALEHPVTPYQLLRYQSLGLPRQITIEPATPSWSDALTYSPLLRRGWTLQERAMSMRRLHFARHCVFWECCSLTAAEVDPSGASLQLEDLEGQQNLSDGALMSLRGLLEANDEDRVENEWFDLVMVYSLCRFSFLSDRLPALSGLAGRIRDVSGRKYLAGYWDCNFPHGLAWYCHMGARTAEVGDEDPRGNVIAPSWSWASMSVSARIVFLSQGPVIWSPKGEWSFPVEVLDVEVEPSGADPTGPVKGGKVRLRGRTITGNLSAMFPDGEWLKSLEGVQHLNYIGLSQRGLGERPSVRIFLDKVGEPDRTAVGLVSLLLVASEEIVDDTDAKGSPKSLAAIVLQPTDKQRASVREYIRVGFIFLPEWHFGKAIETVVDIV